MLKVIVLTANNNGLGGLHVLVVSQGALVFPLSLSADGRQRVGVRISHHFVALVEREEGEDTLDSAVEKAYHKERRQGGGGLLHPKQ